MCEMSNRILTLQSKCRLISIVCHLNFINGGRCRRLVIVFKNHLYGLYSFLFMPQRGNEYGLFSLLPFFKSWYSLYKPTPQLLKLKFRVKFLANTVQLDLRYSNSEIRLFGSQNHSTEFEMKVVTGCFHKTDFSSAFSSTRTASS